MSASRKKVITCLNIFLLCKTLIIIKWRLKNGAVMRLKLLCIYAEMGKYFAKTLAILRPAIFIRRELIMRIILILCLSSSLHPTKQRAPSAAATGSAFRPIRQSLRVGTLCYFTAQQYIEHLCLNNILYKRVQRDIVQSVHKSIQVICTKKDEIRDIRAVEDMRL